MRYVSLFSGIEAATAAWEGLGFRPLSFCEIDPFPSAVLAGRYPDVPNLGDVTKADWGKFVDEHGRPDVVVGGSPCQSFSVAGNRTGLKGASGLMWEYVRAVRELRPRWFVWENVPGALSSTHGEDFGCLLRSMDELGYGLAWRVLDAQFFGVAQRRRRLFVVGNLGEGGAQRACEVLLEPHCLRWDSPSSREEREALAGGAGRGAVEPDAGCLNPGDPQSKRVYSPVGAAPTLNSGTGEGMNIQPSVLAVRTANTGANGSGISEGAAHALDCAGPEAVAYSIPENAINRPTGGTNGPMAYGPGEPSPTLRASKDAPTVCLTGTQEHGTADEGLCGTLTARMFKDAPVVATSYALRMREGKAGGGKGPLVQEDASGTLATRNDQTIFQSSPQSTRDEVLPQGAGGYVVRRLTPTECERLQGFPDGWTRVPYRGKPADECPDGPRYKALGNSMAVPVMRWIGERVRAVDCLYGGDRQ